MARLLVDLGPLKRSRDLRCLFGGLLTLSFASQVVTVAVPFEVFVVSRHSTLQVGLLSAAQLVPTILGNIYGGLVADAHDRRSILLLVQAAQVVVNVSLVVVGLISGSGLWPLYVIMVVGSFVQAIAQPAQISMIATLVEPRDIPVASSIMMLNSNLMMVLGPAVGGLLLGQLGFATTCSFAAGGSVLSIISLVLMGRVEPARSTVPVSFAALCEGFSYFRRDRVVSGALLLDFEAMVFGMPRVTFPALALTVFHGGAATYGLLAAAPAAGAVLAALASGWTANIRRPGLGIVICVLVWGIGMALVGVVPLLALAVVMLALAGAADMVSGVFRNTIVQTTVPDEIRGRLTAVFIGLATGGNRVGDAESGGAAALGGARFAVWSGGLACIVGALFFIWRVPELLRYDQQVALERITATSSG